MTFQKGQSGNPSGRPIGTKDKRNEWRELLETHAPKLINKLVQLALKGDISALKICMDRLIPSIRSMEVDTSTSTTIETYEQMIERICNEKKS